MPSELLTSENVAIGAVLISLSTLGFSVWQWTRTRRSEQLKVSRELMYRIFERRQVLDAVFDGYTATPPIAPTDVAHRTLEWTRSIRDFMFEIHEFRSYVNHQKIDKRSEILQYKKRLNGDLLYIQGAHKLLPFNVSKSLGPGIDNEINELKKWCNHTC